MRWKTMFCLREILVNSIFQTAQIHWYCHSRVYPAPSLCLWLPIYLTSVLPVQGLTQNSIKQCFKPTGCIHAIGPSFSPQAVMKAGRWKSGSVSLHHYVCLNRESLPKVPFQKLGEMSLPFLRMANNGQRRRIRRVCDGKGTLLA